MVGSVFAKELSTNYFSIIDDYLSASEWLLQDAKIPKFYQIQITANITYYLTNILKNSLATSVSVFETSHL